MQHYYYAGGIRVELQNDDDHVAVDRAAAPTDLVERLDAESAHVKQPSAGMLIATTASIGSAQLASLRSAGAVSPVYRRDATLLVPMPEVRVEVDNASQRRLVEQVVDAAKDQMIIIERSDDRFVVRPASGSGADALRIANEIYERASPAASSVRFVQFFPKPALKRRAAGD